MKTADRYESFLCEYAPVQIRLLAYIRSLIHDRTAADDVFQETNLVLWRRFHEFRDDGNFLQWALGISRRQVLKYWRTSQRDRHLFSDCFLEKLTVEAYAVVSEMASRQDILESCIRGLTDRQRDLIRRYYGEGLSAQTIASMWQRSVPTVYKSLSILRRTLLECFEHHLSGAT